MLLDISEAIAPNKIYSSDVTSHCRLSSIKRYGDIGYGRKGEITNQDIHGLEWHERVILTVIAYDRTEGKVIVRNPNGLEWLIDASKITFCNKYGNI